MKIGRCQVSAWWKRWHRDVKKNAPSTTQHSRKRFPRLSELSREYFEASEPRLSKDLSKNQSPQMIVGVKGSILDRIKKVVLGRISVGGINAGNTKSDAMMFKVPNDEGSISIKSITYYFVKNCQSTRVHRYRKTRLCFLHDHCH